MHAQGADSGELKSTCHLVLKCPSHEGTRNIGGVEAHVVQTTDQGLVDVGIQKLGDT